jgi:hypothetical protein
MKKEVKIIIKSYKYTVELFSYITHPPLYYTTAGVRGPGQAQ